MSVRDRVRSALMFALAVAAAQAACLLLIWLAGFLPERPPTERRAGTGPLLMLVSFGVMLAIPVFLHDGPIGRRWAPMASRQATIIFSIAGLLAGYIAGGLLAENGWFASWTLGTRAGAVAGSFAALALLNLFSSGT